ncbi:ScbA/BarX family gamma-butyrolactone biosynthesis protein [Streptomyces scabiei]|uniref:ScbA/BarX family gamma-butyrolactone biosynthesis protein n=1 Tax=Streptomyces scabiei TaxID=1930 RepID=UPI00298FAADB|nr:ScbA/BarX family gamma-butyrolactone biosynthesis protein [Streptomyces scabiei]MDW8809008.1 ScbA/BarX family gamma-butyrolactone biosynthesis protein [Streptomyces scabiei]
MPYLMHKTAEDHAAAEGEPTSRLSAKTPHSGLTTTVPREYVHRAAVSEVFLTGWDAAEPLGTDSRDAFTIRAQWPRSHALFARRGVYQDPMLLIESVRQVGSLLAHAEFDVPFGHQFLMGEIFFETAPELLVAGIVPTDVELRTVCGGITRRGHSLSGMRYDVTVLRDGAALATAGAALRCMSPSVFRRLRGDRLMVTHRPAPPAIDPAAVGHSSARDVVLADLAPGARNRWELRVDTAHPTYFDHPVDHVPGMVLLEAARQAAHASTGMPDALVLGMASEFTRYAEFDAPCWIEAHPEPQGTAGDVLVRVSGTQRGETVFTAELIVSPRLR